MLQSFEVKGGPEMGRRGLERLRAQLATDGLHGFFIPHEDAYQNEYLPAAHERLAWVTGFTGSAGSAFVLADKAVVFVDGRYTLQAESQLDGELFEVQTVPQGGPETGAFAWLASVEGLSGKVIGFDPELMTPKDARALQAAAGKAGASLRAVTQNPVDAAWSDRPPVPAHPIRPHPLSFTGESHADKRARIGAALKSAGLDATLLTAPASIAWLLNVRGSDVDHTPLPLARLMIAADGRAMLFAAPEASSAELTNHLGQDVAVRSFDALAELLPRFRGRRIGLDPALAPAKFFEMARQAGCEVVDFTDPCALPRACKNDVEIAGAERAHQRDGAALTRFLHWLDRTGGGGRLSEIDAVKALEGFRKETGALQDISFETISGAGPNGAIVHYRVSEATNRKLEPGSLFLVDSGGQYLDGTTDVTRTIAIGDPTPAMRLHYTLVLKGHIALSTVRFPEGTTGHQLDVLARHALWQSGLDYAHGTGHGVGAYLGVHEGPQRISKAVSTVALQPGMIVSNEPGYYKNGAYGIRIENLQYVTRAASIPGGDIDMLGFRTLTLAPLDPRLVDMTLLDGGERQWLSDYHARVLAEIAPRLESEDRDWLAATCKAFGAG
jgi:Xaa-Pro aminopeptidase